MKDIADKRDIKIIVDSFYKKVRENALLSPVFAATIPDGAWPVHLERMYDFWNAVLFAEKGFEGNPMQKHFRLPIDESHFSQWLRLFEHTVDEHFAGPKADEAKKRAHSIAQIMQHKLSSFKN